mgnify:CR=1 FL=1
MNPWHYVLGYAGLIPFVGLSVLVALDTPMAEGWLLSYAALIFSFLGGVQWMATLKADDTNNLTLKQVVSVSVMLWAWLWLIVPQVDWFIWAGLSFWLLWVYERVTLMAFYSTAFMQMRRNLSFVAGLSLISAGLL